MHPDRAHRRNQHFVRHLGVAGLAGLLALSCTKDSTTTPPVAVAAVTVSGGPGDGVVIVGQSVQLSAAPKDAGGAALTGRAISWSSSNAGVATVSPAGLVSAVAAGAATITATSGGQSGTVDLSVRVAIPLPAAGATQPITTTLMGGAVIITVPAGAVSAGTSLSVGPAAASTVPVTTRLLAGTAQAFGPEGTQFASPLTLSLRFDPTGLSATDRSGLALYLVKNGEWERVTGSTVSATSDVVTAPITHFSTYAVLKRATPATVAVSAGNGQTAPAGTAVAVRPAVLVADAGGHGVEGIGVTFAVSGGGGTVTGATATTDVNGIATVGSWTLGPAAGPNTLVATVTGLTAATFNATASLPPAPVIRLAASTASFAHTIGNAPPAAQTIAITNVGGSALADLVVGIGTPGWLTATLSSSSAPSVLTLAADGTGLAAGTYTGVARVESGTSSNSPQTVNVTLTVSASAARVLAVTQQPAGARSGKPFDTQPVVEIRDASGNRVTTATNTIVASIVSDTATMSGTAVVTAVNGVATFTNLAITGRGSAQIRFESGTLAPATTQGFFVALGVPDKLTLLGGNNQTGIISTTLDQPLVVRVADIDGFAVPGVTVNWVIAADGSLGSTSSVTNAAGIATNTWRLGATIGAQTVTAAVVGVTGPPLTFTATTIAPPAGRQQ
jgi:adhesin/invasin